MINVFTHEQKVVLKIVSPPHFNDQKHLTDLEVAFHLCFVTGTTVTFHASPPPAQFIFCILMWSPQVAGF